LLSLPFILMELVNRRVYNEGFPFAVFIVLWLLGLVFSLALLPLLRRWRAGERPSHKPLDLAWRLGLLAVSAGLWLSVVSDQMACFLGVLLCD
jgi:hypothetical protein